MRAKARKGYKIKMLKNHLLNNLFILYHVFKAAPMYIIGVLSCSVLEALLVVTDLWVTKCIVNALLGEGFSLFGILIFYGIYIITEYLFLQIKIILTNYFKSIKEIELSVYMRRLFYSKVKELDLYCYENHEFYNDYERAINEIDTRPVQVVDSLADFLSCILSLLFITMIVFEPVFLLAAAGVVIEYLIYLKKLNQINYQMDRKTSPFDRKIDFVKMLFQNRDFAKESRISNADAFFTEWNDDAMKEDFNVTKSYYKKTIFPSVCSSASGGIATFAVGVYLCRCMIAGRYNVSDFVYLLTSFHVFSQSMIRLFQIFPELLNHGMYIGNMKKILDYEPAIRNRDRCSCKEKKVSVQPFKTIELKEVSFSYPGSDRTVLNDISFTLRQGDKAAIVGQNGCGKSTLIKLLLDFYHAEEGGIFYNGIDYKEYDDAELRQVFGVVFQDYQIYAFSIAENVLMRKVASKQDEEQVVSALKFAGLWEKVNSLENGIHTVITKEFDDQGVYLSGGECQKLVIARAYVHDAEVLIFDEPTSALDAMSEYDFFEKIRKMGENRTVVYVSHRLSATVSADCIYLIKDGKLAEKGTHGQLMEQSGDYCQMFTVQSEGYI